jgi:tetratricopeptide (TPR) repeat protein
VALLIIWWKRGRITIKDVLPLLPFFAAGIAMGVLTAHMEVVRVGVGLRPGPWRYADSAIGQLAARCIIAGHALWFYVGKLILPYPLIFNYPRWNIDPSNPLQYLYPITAAGAVIAVAINYKRLGRGPVVAVLYYVGTLFPALGFFNVWPMQYSFVADHFAYLSLIGLIALAAALARKHLDRRLLAGIGGAVLCLLGVVTFFQARIYTDLKTLWVDTLNKTKQQSWFAANNYGALILEGDVLQDRRQALDVSERWFQKVIKLKHDHAEARRNLAKVAETRAILSQQAIGAGEHPTTQPAEYYQQAIDYYRDAIKCYDGFIQARFDLAQRLLALGKTDEAIEQFQEILKRNPREVSTHRELARIALQKGNLDEAIKQYQIVVDLQPKSALAHADLGDVLLQQGRTVEGLGEWAQARSLEPGNISWPIHFGVRMAESGKYSQAVAYFRDALKIDPQSAEALTNMGIVAALTGFPKEAKANLEQALKVSPGFAKAKESLEALESGKLGPATTRPTTGPGVLSN